MQLLFYYSSNKREICKKGSISITFDHVYGRWTTIFRIANQIWWDPCKRKCQGLYRDNQDKKFERLKKNITRRGKLYRARLLLESLSAVESAVSRIRRPRHMIVTTVPQVLIINKTCCWSWLLTDIYLLHREENNDLLECCFIIFNSRSWRSNSY